MSENIPDGWKETILENVSQYISRGISPSYDTEGVLVVNQRCIRNGGIDFAKARFTNKSKKKINEEKKLQSFDILICSTGVGTLGRVGQLKNILDEITADSHVSIVRPSKDIDPVFLGYCLKSKEKKIEHLAEGSTGQTELPRKKLANFEILLPGIHEQKTIAKVLSSLDDKIELLQKQNKTLEQMAQAIFKEWFIDFNFPDKNGKSYKTNGGKMVGSEMGLIPEGWKVATLQNVSVIYDYKRVPLSGKDRANKQGQYPYYGATKIMDYIDDYIFDGVYLLLAEDGSVVDDFGFPVLQYVFGKFWVNNHAHILQGKNGISTEWLYLFFKNRKIADVITGAVQLKINQTNLMRIKIVVPANNILNSSSAVIKSIFCKKVKNERQIQSLKKFRDVLLPKLMNGQIRVNFNN